MKIRVSDTDKLDAAIAAAEGNLCSARCITAASVQAEVERISNELDRLLAKKDQVGAAVAVDLHAQTFPNAYRGVPYSTQFTVERFPSGWFVTDIFRLRCDTRRRKLYLSTDARRALANRIVREF